MAIIIEDGSIVSGANSYASVIDLNNYATETGVLISGDTAELLAEAKRYVETLRFIGRKSTKDQTMQWPRYGAMIDGFHVETNEIPQSLISLQCEVALSIDAGVNPLSVVGRATKKEKVGDIEVEYSDSASQVDVNPAISALSRKLTSGSVGGISLSLSRA